MSAIAADRLQPALHGAARRKQAAAAVVRSGWIVGGPRLAEFEVTLRRTLRRTPRGWCLVLDNRRVSGAARLGIGPATKSSCRRLTFIASVNVIVHAGATPVFADIDPETWNIDPGASNADHATYQAIMPVDQTGLPCDIDAINASRGGTACG